METAHGQTFVIQGVVPAFPMQESQYGTVAVGEYIHIPVQGIRPAGTGGAAQAVNAFAQVYGSAAHREAVVSIQVEHGFWGTKAGTWGHENNTADFGWLPYG